MRAAGVMGSIVGAGLVSLAYALHEARQYRLRAFTIPALAPGSGPLRLLHLSDLHLAPQDRDRIAWVRGLARLRPDLVVVTGDFMAHQEAVRLVEEAFDPLLDVPGMFVLGSNDYWAPQAKNPLNYLRNDRKVRLPKVALPTDDLCDLLTSRGWIDLDNRRANVVVAGVEIDARGTDDPHIRKDDYPSVAGPFRPDSQLRLGVTHAPYLRVLDAMAADDADLILAGHTHGGQVCIPFIGALTTNCDLDPARAKGLSTHGPSWMHVSAGVGTSPLTPIRVACAPEASLLLLTEKATDSL
jgi:uncharacterized protein